jgi:hypothetical protein
VTQIILDESFVAPIAEGAGPTTGPEVARSSVKKVTWDTFGLFPTRTSGWNSQQADR